jgi:pyruvate carboxylase
MAQFMVQNNLSEKDVVDRASSLSFPSSVVEYFQGYLGIPPFGFPEPLRSRVIAGKKLPNGGDCFTGRPGAEMAPADFDSMRVRLVDMYGSRIDDRDVVSYSQYPKVLTEIVV